MTPLVALLVAGTAIGIFAGIYFFLTPDSKPETVHSQVLGRLEHYISRRGEQPAPVAEQFGPVESLVRRVRGALVEADESNKGDERRDELTEELIRADIHLRASEWGALQIVVGFGIFVLTTLRFNVVVGAFAGVAIPYFGARFYLHWRQRRRLNKFDAQLPGVIVLLANGLKAGFSFPQAMQSIEAASRPPVSSEFARACREIQLGVGIDESLARMVERNPSEDLDLMMTAVQIQRVVGGNLAEILDMIAFTIRERVRIKGEIRTLTAQARTSGWIISLLPIGLALILTVVAPDYFNPMLQETAGRVMLGLGLISMAIGARIIKRIVSIRI